SGFDMDAPVYSAPRAESPSEAVCMENWETFLWEMIVSREIETSYSWNSGNVNRRQIERNATFDLSPGILMCPRRYNDSKFYTPLPMTDFNNVVRDAVRDWVRLFCWHKRQHMSKL